jgi:hypothetical protein
VTREGELVRPESSNGEFNIRFPEVVPLILPSEVSTPAAVELFDRTAPKENCAILGTTKCMLITEARLSRLVAAVSIA